MKRAVVTGAGGAFGTAISAELRSRGWKVVGLDLSPGSSGDILPCDVTDDEAVVAAMEDAVGRLGGLDALVNNAGLGGPASAGSMPGDRVRAMIDVNLLGSWRCSSAAIEELVKSRGRVVFIASRMSFIGLPLGAAYGVSKRGVVAYADALRAEYGTHVKVTCVHPAMVKTPIHDATKEAGLNLEGFSTEEPLAGVVARVVEALESPKPKRDVAITRTGALQLAVARHFPGLVDRIVAKQLAKRVAAGELDGAEIAAPLRDRHGRA
ncbi:MAG: SDR family oxidoreductase [Thermoleophilaceae bacterium]|nr:SDR family oxidoreductase [Thermoleophilaceae bacterium]